MTTPNPAARAIEQTPSGASGKAGAGHGPAGPEVFLTLHRRINAPVEAVYGAWTDPEVL